MEVGDARVAVHGTEFHVVRSSQGVVVDVARGVVAVRRAVDAPGSGHRLEAPHRAAFAMDGTGYRQLPTRRASAPAEGSVPGLEGAPIAARLPRSSSHGPDEQYAGVSEQLDDDPTASPAPAHGPAPAVPVVPSTTGSAPTGSVGAAPPGWSAERVRREVVSCIVRAAAARSSEVRVTVASQLVVDLDAEGATRALRFDPPIRPDFQACAQSVFGARFAPGAGRMVVPVEVVLEPSGK